MRGLLIWGLLIVIGESLVRLLSWSLLIFVPLSVMDAWKLGSETKWITTLLTIAVAVSLLVRRGQVRCAEAAKISWLLVSLLTCISVVAFGTEGTVGYTILKQPTRRLAHLLTVGSFVAAGATYWRLIEKRKRSQRFAVALAGFAGSLVFVRGIFHDLSFERLFVGGIIGLASLATEFLLPLALGAGWLLSIQSLRNGNVPLIREKWFEFALIFLAVVMGLSTTLRVHG